MREIVEKRLRIEKILFITMIVSLAVNAISFVLIALNFIQWGATLIYISTEALLFSAIYYAIFCLPFKKSLKLFDINELENLTGDVSLGIPTLPRSKIYCAEKVIVSQRPWVIIPYSEIARTHFFIRYLYTFPIQKSIIIYTKDGQKFTLNSNADEFGWWIANHVFRKHPDIKIGTGK